MSRIVTGITNPGLAARYLSRKIKTKSLQAYYSAPWISESSIWDDWDMAIVLDACRPDVLEECADEFAFIPQSVPFRRSNASSSREWMHANFCQRYRKELQETVYVTANPYSEHADIDTELFGELDEVWKYAWSSEMGTQLPEAITDRAIHAARKRQPERLLVHYMQPHFPSVPVDLDSKIDIERFGEGGGTDVFQRLKRGDLSYRTVWHAYRENCRYVLESVDRLLRNVDAERVLITADHGNAFGEKGYYRHPGDCPIPAIRNVPWVITDARDEGTHEPSAYDTDRLESTVSDRLTSLGYV